MSKFETVVTIAMVHRIFVILASCIFCIGCNPKDLPVIRDAVRNNDEYTTKLTEQAIEKDSELKELDNLCKQIPLSENFRFYSKRLASSSPIVFVFYYAEEDFAVSEARFRNYFLADGWEVTDTISMNKITEFRKGTYRISIQYGGIGKNANYGFSCGKVNGRN